MVGSERVAVRAGWIGIGLALAGCGGPGEAPRAAIALAAPKGGGGSIEVRQTQGRPRLTLVARDGDPTAAVVVTVVTDLGPVATTALAAVVEGRVRSAGLDVDARVSRSAFRVRLATNDAVRAGAFLRAVDAAFSRPVAPGSAEVNLVEQRLVSLRRNPLDAPELVPIVACTGALGIAGGDAMPNVATAAGVLEVEAWRTRGVDVARTSIAAVGPKKFVESVAGALGETPAWPVATAAADRTSVPGEQAGMYVAAGLTRSVRLSLAVRVADPAAATAAAERLGAPGGPLAARLAALAEPWRLVAVTGAARPRGGCVSAVLEADRRPNSSALEAAAALAAATTRKEMAIALSAGATTDGVAREILTAADPRDAASRASWWALAERAEEPGETWSVALGVPPTDRPSPTEPTAQHFRDELSRAVAGMNASVAERRLSVERGQGEVWVLLANTCGVAEEGQRDAGSGAIAAIASVEERRVASDVALEPWVTADGIGVVAHAAFRDPNESPADLARRVADAAARALTAGGVSTDAATAARSILLDRIERADGRQGAAFEALANALSPDHPSWAEPLGVWSRVASGGLENIRLRAQALSGGPLRVAVIANVDMQQANAAADAVDRWLAPSLGDRACHAATGSLPRSGVREARLPSDADVAQALIAAPLTAAGRPFADVIAVLLGGDGGPLALALRETAVSSSVRVVGGSRAQALVVDVRAPSDVLGSATAQAKFTLQKLGQTTSEADLERANARLAQQSLALHAEPRFRLGELWSGAAAARRVVGLAALRTFLDGWVRDGALVVVEAHPE